MLYHRLSEHFFLSEFVRSETAARRGIDNTPGPVVLEMLTYNAERMEQVRSLLNAPLSISSGFRCLELNRAIGSADTSAHVKGLATDFIAPGFGSPIEVCDRIAASGITFDQLIYEHTWIHIGWALPDHAPRLEKLTLDGKGYVRGIVGQRKEAA